MATPNGLSDQIMAHMAVSGPQNVKQVSEAIGSTMRRVTRTMYDLRNQGRLHKVDQQGGWIVYSATPPEHRHTNPRYIAPHRELTPADHNIWSHRDLALIGR